MVYGSATGNMDQNPETLGLVHLGGIEEGGLSYEFHMLDVWKHKDSGRIFWGSDSGCSCPSPYEDDYFRGPDDNSLTEIRPESWKAFESAVEAFPAEQQEKVKLLDAVRPLVKKMRKKA